MYSILSYKALIHSLSRDKDHWWKVLKDIHKKSSFSMSYIPKLPGAIQDVVAVYQTEHLAKSNENKQSENKKDCSSSNKSRRKFTRQRGNNPKNLEASKIPIFMKFQLKKLEN